MGTIGVAEAAPVEDEFTRQRGIIVLLDAVGTKGMLASRPPEAILSSWRRTVTMFEQAAVETKDITSLTVAVAAFSDTILVTVTASAGTTVAELVPHLERLIFEPFYAALLNGVFLRGAIAAGTFYLTPASTKIIGPAIDEAAEWYEQADWIGLIASPTMGRYLDLMRINGTDVSGYFAEYEIPTKHAGDSKRWAFAWPAIALKIYSAAESDILLAFAERGGSVGVAVESKYRNTIEFINFLGHA